MRWLQIAGIALAFAVGNTYADQVTVKGVHLCCGKCVNGVAGALKEVKGVSNASCDQKACSVAFDAANAQAAQAALAALAKAGYAGKASSGGKELAFPQAQGATGKADQVLIAGAHICCAKCAKAAIGAVQSAAGVAEVVCQAGTLNVTGKNVDVAAALKALNNAGFSGAAIAGPATVKVAGVHLCCKKCLNGVGAALGNAAGVSQAACDADNRAVSFQASGAAAVQAGLKALAEGGYAGQASANGHSVAFPSPQIKRGTKSDKFTFRGVHLCCAKCTKAAGSALGNVAGVSDVSCDKDAGTVTLTGSGIDVSAAVKALNGAGLNGDL